MVSNLQLQNCTSYETLKHSGFFSSKAHPNLRIKDYGTHYEYYFVYVTDFIFISKDPMKYIRIMEYEYQLKGLGLPANFLDGNMELGKNGKMSWSTKKDIKNVTSRIEKLLEPY